MRPPISLRKRYALPLAFCLGLSAQAQTTIAIEDFDGSTPSWTNDVSSLAFVDPSSPAEGLFIQASTHIGTGNTAYGRDLGGETDEPTLSPYTFTFDPVSVSSSTNYQVSFDYYAFGNADAGSYEIFIDGNGQGAVEWYNDPDTDPVQGTIAVPVSGASTIGLQLTGTLNGGDDVIELDNVKIVELMGIQAPTGLSATPISTDSIEIAFTPDGSNDALIVYNTVDSFGTPVDATSYTTGETLPGGGIVAGVFSSSPTTISGLVSGTTYYVTAFSIDGSDSYSSASSSFTGTTNTYALQITDFDIWSAVSVASDRDWSVSGSSASANGYNGDVPSEDWLISSEVDLDATVAETFEFTYEVNYTDAITGLEVFYTDNYTSDPSTTTWTAFADLNTELTDYVTNGSGAVEAAIDLSAISGTAVRLAFKYTSSGTGSGTTSSWYLNDPLISGNDASEIAIALSATPTSLDEGDTLSVTLTLPGNVDTDTEYLLSSNGDGSELSFPATVTVLSGTSSISFDVTGLTDSSLDGDQTVTLIASATGHTLGTLEITVSDIDEPLPGGDIIITQYYEGSTGNNKYIELTNTSDNPVDLTGWLLARWGNEAAEDYKTAGNVSDETLDLTPLGTLTAGQTVLIAHSDAATPIAAGDAALTQGYPGATSFTGNDSIVIYNSATTEPENIVDAIGFTFSGDEGANTSLVRINSGAGYDLIAGSNVTTYPSIWASVDLSTVNAAASGSDEFLGTSALVASPTSVNFSTGTQTVSEADGSFDLSVAISDLTSGIVVVDVIFNSGSSTADSSDITFSSPQQLTFDASSLVSPQTITVPIIDDGLDGSTEIASFTLSLTSGTAIIAAPSTQEIYIQDADVIIPDLIISEVTDPSDTANAKYVEIYNPSASEVSLDGLWTLSRFPNGDATAADIALAGSIPAGESFVVAYSATVFALYNVGDADQVSGSISGNGNDVYALYFDGDSSTGILVDVYGVIGVNGTGEDWEYTDSRAVRDIAITSGNDTWTASEWTITAADVADMTPGVHPDPNVFPPTDVTVTEVSETEVSLAFTPSGDDVIIVFDNDGSFTAPTGTPPSVDDSFAGGTVIYVGQDTSFAHTGLSAGTQYFYSVFSSDGSEYSSTVEVDATTAVAGLLNSEDFETTDAGDWFNAAVSSDDSFEISTDTDSNSAKIDGSVNSGADNQYLVSPALNFSAKADGSISFDFVGGYDDGDADSFELVYSTDYSGSGNPEASATWTEISFDFSSNLEADAPLALANSGAVALPSALNGASSVYLAFRYTADGTLTGSEVWHLDNILVTADNATASDPLGDYLTSRGLTSADFDLDVNGNGYSVAVEYLAGFGDGLGSDVIEFGIETDSSLTLTLTSDLATEPEGITVELWATSDLTVAFASVAFTHSVVDNGDGTYTHSYTETTPPESDTRFLQLSITAE